MSGSHATGKSADANAVIEVHAARKVRKSDDSRAEAKAIVEDLGKVLSEGRRVMEENDSLRKCHRASRPGDDGKVPEVRGDIEETKAVQEGNDMAAGDDQE